jgi:hypothetical protein
MLIAKLFWIDNTIIIKNQFNGYLIKYNPSSTNIA